MTKYKNLIKQMFQLEETNEQLVIASKKMQAASFDYQQFSNSSTGDVNVPKWLADTLVNIDPVTSCCDLSIGDGQLVISLLEQQPGIKNVAIADSKLINIKTAVARIKRRFDVNITTILYSNYKELEEKTKNMKFDCVLTNPPFFGKGHPDHLKFLHLGHNLSSRYVLFVQPSTYLVDHKKENTYYRDARTLIKDNLVSVTLYTKDVFEGAQLNTGVAGIVVDKTVTVIDYDVVYNNLNTVVKFNDIDDINIFADNNIYLTIKEKLLNCANKHSMQDDVESQGSWCIPIPKLQRYRFLPDRAQVIRTEDYIGDHAAYYPTKELADAAYKWLHDPVAILSLHIYKQDMNIASGRNLRSVPSFNTVEDFVNVYEKIGLTPEEVQWCNNIYNNSTDYIKFS